MSKLCRKYNLSDNGLRKICKRYNIPTPSAGYWARKQHGRNAQVIPLRGEAAQSFYIQVRGEVNESFDAPPSAQTKALVDKVQKSNFEVPQQLVSPHPLVERAQTALNNAKVGKNGLLQPRAKNLLNIQVSLAQLPRALKIMNTVLNVIKGNGGSVSFREDTRGYYEKYIATIITFQGEGFSLTLNEVTREDKETGNWTPTGRLSLKLGGVRAGGSIQQRFYDGPGKKVEHRLPEFFINLCHAVEHNKRYARREKWRRLEKERAEHEYAEKRETQQLEAERKDRLHDHINGWHKAEVVRNFTRAAARQALKRHTEIDSFKAFNEWFRWAMAYADSLDPLSKELVHVDPEEDEDNKRSPWAFRREKEHKCPFVFEAAKTPGYF